jgi:Flp pilus assembly protein TadG
MRRSETGALSAFVAVVAFALVMVAGMVYDGGQVVATLATARDLASSAARAGAQEVDVDSARSGDGPLLDPDRASAAAEAFLAATGHTGTTRVDGATITVTVSLRQPMRILPVGARTVTATDTATAFDRPQDQP